MSKPKMAMTTMRADAAVGVAVDELRALGEECREAVDNTPESLQSTDRCSSLADSADALESLEDIDDPAEDLLELVGEVSWPEAQPRRASRPLSRAARRDNAVAALSAVVSRIEELEDNLDEDSLDKSLTEWRDSVQEAIDAAEDCEFPGMRG